MSCSFLRMQRSLRPLLILITLVVRSVCPMVCGGGRVGSIARHPLCIFSMQL